MAGITFLGGRFEVGHLASPGMTLRATDLGMFSCQLESYQTVIKCVTICINPIVTAQAILSICLQVGLHEVSFNLFMAGRTDSLIKMGIAICMTIRAREDVPIRLGHMRSKGVSKSVVGDIRLGHFC
jgi:hypothetical protein